MSKVIKIKKGLDIKLKGTAEKIYSNPDPSQFVAVKPPDFPGLIPRLTVKAGDKVKAGTTLFYNKQIPEIKFSSPVSGQVKEVTRGERRRILEIVVEADSTIKYEDFKPADPSALSREEIIKKIQDAGLWPMIRQIPYGVVAYPDKLPKAVFISGFYSGPLAADMDFVLKGEEKDFQKGLDVLIKLSGGKVHLSVNADFSVSKVFSESRGVEMHSVSGPHPAGNPGIQVHHIDPVNKGELVWYVQPEDVLIIGRLFGKGIYDASKIVALGGSEVKNPRYYKTIGGTSVENLVKDNVNSGELRYISGDVLTGTKINKIGYLGFYDNQVTVIPEGNYYEMLGWVLPGLNKFSVSRSFLSWLTPNRQYKIDTNLKGGVRPFVATGEYEKVLPMDIFPMQLLKAILVEDIDLMEKLGIYEVTEEDFALCEFVCPSKIDIQSIIRDGLDLMIKELE